MFDAKYKFNKKQLLDVALNHSSYANEFNLQSNERLEFLGDSALSLIVSTYLYDNYPNLTEGELTRMRSFIVCEDSLVEFAKLLKLNEAVKLGKGEEATGGRTRKSILADAFEALLAAILLDSDYTQASEWLLSIIEPSINKIVEKKLDKDYKTRLQEILQRDPHAKIGYCIDKVEGPEHLKTFSAHVVYNGKTIGHGHGQSKKGAEQNAARSALKRYGE